MSSAYVLTGWRISSNWLIPRLAAISHQPFYSSLHWLRFKTLKFPALHCTLSLIVRVITSLHGPQRKHRSSVVQLFFIRNLLPSSGHCLYSYYSATGLYATILFTYYRRKDFSLLHSVQNISGGYAPSYPLGTGGNFPGVKAAGAWSWPLTSI
jgi:hypothetical protein